MPSDLFDLRGKVAVITGSGRGIGRWLAEGFAHRHANVVVTGRSLDQIESVAAQIRDSGREAIALQVDVTCDESVDGLIAEVVDRFKTIDVLVNNAGQTSNRVPAMSITVDDLNRVIDTNVKGTFLTAQSAAKRMSEHGGGRIINIASTAAVLVRHGLPNSTYAASKAAVSMMTKALADEWADFGIQVNCVAPGRFVVDRNSKHAGPGSAEYKQVIETIPMRRTGTADDILGPVLFFASDAASYITGQTLFVDGGRTVL